MQLNRNEKRFIQVSALRHLHDNVDITNCPFNMRLTNRLKEITYNLNIGRVPKSRTDC
jgi:aminoglycoside phosphotransferase